MELQIPTTDDLNSEHQELSTSDARMLQLISILKTSGKIRFRQEFLNVIEMRKQNFSKIESGNIHFTVKQISIACQHYEVNANWIHGISENIFNNSNQE